MKEIPNPRAEWETHIRLAKVQRWTFWSKMLFAYFLLFTALAILGFIATKTKPLNGNERLWSWLFLVVYLPWICLFLAPRTLANLKATQPSWWKRVGTILGANIGIGFIYYLAVFGGTPKLLHYANHSDGTVVTTITGKADWVSKYQGCKPRVELEAVSWLFYGRDICISRNLFEAAKVGDRVCVRGKVSPYAIEPTHMELVP